MIDEALDAKTALGQSVPLSDGLDKAGIEFRFIEFNKRRAMRGAEAARVACIENGDEDWLWMSKRDISKNMMIFGNHPELVKAYKAYG